MLDSALDREVRWLGDDEVRVLSEGRVVRPWTINERTSRPERGGLHCAQIFGPVEDLSCICTKYQGAGHRDVVCDKCGVLVTETSVRERRFGHIDLSLPLMHPWSGATIEALLVLPAGLREVAAERIGKAPKGLNALYAELLKRNEIVGRCVQKRAPAALLDHERGLLQSALDAVFGAVPKRPGRQDKLGARIRRSLAEGRAPEVSPLRETLLACGARV